MNEAKYREAEATLWRGYGIQPDEKRIRLATTGSEVRLQLIGAGPPVLFVHGGPNAGSTWAPIIGAFDDRQCVLVDRPGTGLSEAIPGGPTPPAIAELADHFVADVADALGVDELDVVASSFGGYLALRSAATAPHRIGRMVQMAAPALLPMSTLPPFMKLMSKTWVRRILGVLPPNEKVGDNILRQIGHGASLDAGRIPASFKQWYLDLQRHTDTMRNDGDLIGTVLTRRGIAQGLPLTDGILGAVPTPTLFLWGEDDGFGGADVAHHVAEAMPNAELEMIPEAGHLPWLDFPEHVGRRSRAHLEEAG